jgi:hypothetical protein
MVLQDPVPGVRSANPPYPPAPDSDHVLIEPRPPNLAEFAGLSLSQVPPSGKYMPVYPVANIVVQDQLRFATEQTIGPG